MVKFSIKKIHQEFAVKLLAIALIIGVTFSAWYLVTKRGGAPESKVPQNASKTAVIPGDDLADMKAIYLDQAKKIMSSNYADAQIPSNFVFYNLTTKSEWKDLGKEDFWTKFNIDSQSAKYAVWGNEVDVSFQAKTINPLNKSNETVNFVRKLSFGDYNKDNRSANKTPILLEDAIISNDLTSNPVYVQTGDKFPSFFAFSGVENGKLSKIDFSAKTKEWKLLVFFPNAFSNVCPTECMELLQQHAVLKKMNVEVYAISGDLPQTLLAWSNKFFGGLPYKLVSDIDLKAAQAFGFKDWKNNVALRGTIIVDSDNVIRYMSAQDNKIGRNVEEIIRIITALQTPGLKPVNWESGDAVLTPAK